MNNKTYLIISIIYALHTAYKKQIQLGTLLANVFMSSFLLLLLFGSVLTTNANSQPF